MLRARIMKTGWDADLVIESPADPLPSPARDEVLIEVLACGVCYRDCIDREGRFPFMSLPITPGHEVCGRVIATGPDAGEFRAGDRVATMHRDFCGVCAACAAGDTSLCDRAAAVLGLLRDGGYATHLVAPERCFFRIPEEIPPAEAAVLHCTFGTAYRGLCRFGPVVPGRRVVVTGANGGVGSAAVQIASRLGAEVIAVVRSEAHRDFVAKLGASHVIVDSGGGFHKRLPGPKADVALDCVGVSTFNSSLRSLRQGGGLVAIGNIVPEKAALNLGYLITSGLSVVGSSGATRADMAKVLALHRDSPFVIPIFRAMDLTEADAAQRLVRSGGMQGRIVLVPRRDGPPSA